MSLQRLSWVIRELHGSGDRALPPPSPQRKCKLSWKVNMKKATVNGQAFKAFSKASKLLDDTRLMQFSGMSGEPTLLRTPLGYTMLNDAGFVSPCASPSHVYVNGKYQGIYSNTENPDKTMMKRRYKQGLLRDDDMKGKGTFYKEVWPISSDPAAYTNLTGPPGISNPKMKEEGNCDLSLPGASCHTHLFANLVKEAEDCVRQGNAFCTQKKAAEILDKYADKESFVNGLVGLALAGNWDSPFYIVHNFMMYIKSDKLFYSAWDLDQTLGSSSGTMGIQSFLTYKGFPYPWYHYDLSATDYSLLCVPIPGYPGYQLGQFACNAASNLMARAWKDDFFATFERVHRRVYSLAKQHVARWEKQIESGIQCANENGYWPSLTEQKTALRGSAGTSMDDWMNTYTRLWTNLGRGNASAWAKPIWPNSVADVINGQQPLAQADIPFCVNPHWGARQIGPGDMPSSFMSAECYPTISATCKAKCANFFASCYFGYDNCDRLMPWVAGFSP